MVFFQFNFPQLCGNRVVVLKIQATLDKTYKLVCMQNRILNRYLEKPRGKTNPLYELTILKFLRQDNVTKICSKILKISLYSK